MPSNVKLLAGASGGEPTDANFKNVTLLLHGDGSNGAQNNTFIDSSTNNFTITRNGNTTQGSFSPYGSNWSNYFDGSGDYLTISSNAAFDFGTSDFTIECWFLMNSSSSNMSMVNNYNAGTSGWGIQYRSDVGEFRFFWGDTVLLSYAATPTIGAWTHIAVARSGTSLKMYINGSQVASATNSTSLSGGSSVVIGAINASGYVQNFNGYISNVRVLKGTALYTSAFTPSTTPLTAITNTSLLTCADNRFRDGSTNNFTITRNGDVKVTNFAPFAPSSAYSTTTNGGSAVFDGTSDYCRIASSQTALQFGTGDFTIDGWVFSTNGTGAYQHMLTGGTSWTSGSGGVYWYYNSGSPYIGAAWNQVATNPAVNSGTLATNTWHHFAFVRSGNTLTLYVNGTSVDTLDVTGTSLAVNNQSQTNIGGGGWDNDFAGYMSNVRVVKGTAVYTANFTPPTSPTTAVTNTQLLLNATNAAIFDNSMKNDLETVGNAQISTSVKKFGTGSIYFDGTSDGLFIPATPQLGFGTGDYTVEFWLYMSALPGSKYTLLDFRTASVAEAHTIYVNSSGYMGFFNGSSDVTSSSQPLSINTWYHVAYSRGSGTLKIFVAGTQAYSAANTIDYQATRPLTIGAGVSGIEVLNGYIDDLRITKGIARYTANFTAPTAPFPNK